MKTKEEIIEMLEKEFANNKVNLIYAPITITSIILIIIPYFCQQELNNFLVRFAYIYALIIFWVAHFGRRIYYKCKLAKILIKESEGIKNEN